MDSHKKNSVKSLMNFPFVDKKNHQYTLALKFSSLNPPLRLNTLEKML